jgi:hypothetical protein
MVLPSLLFTIGAWLMKAGPSLKIASKVLTVLSAGFTADSVYDHIHKKLEETPVSDDDQCEFGQAKGSEKDQLYQNFASWYADDTSVQEESSDSFEKVNTYMDLAEASEEALDFRCADIEEDGFFKRNTQDEENEQPAKRVRKKVLSVLLFSKNADFQLNLGQFKELVETSFQQAIQRASERRRSEFQKMKTDYDAYIAVVSTIWSDSTSLKYDTIERLHQVLIARFKRKQHSDAIILPFSHYLKDEFKRFDPNVRLKQKDVEQIRRNYYLFNSMANRNILRMVEGKIKK